MSGTGRLNKDIYAKQSIKSGIAFHQGDVLYGKLRPYLQNWLLPTFDGLAVGDFWVLQPQNADSSFLYRLIQSRQFDEVANQSTGTKMPRADWKLVSKTVFSIPSNISEQAAIGTYFTALDSLITLHQRKCANLCSPSQVVFSLLFATSTFSWEQRKFEEIAVRSSVICSDDTLPRVEYEDIVSGTGRLNKDIYAKQSIKSGIAFHQGDVLYGKLRPYLQNWLLPTFDGLAVGDFWVLQPQNADSSFLYRLIQSRQFDEVANQSTGTKMPRADWKLVSKTVFSIPSNISEQAAIGTYFTALDSLITLHQRKGKAAVSGCFLNCSSLEKSSAQSRTLELFGQTSNQEIKYIIDGLSILGGKLRNFCVKLIILLSYTRINDIAKYHISRNTECVHNIN